MFVQLTVGLVDGALDGADYLKGEREEILGYTIS